MTGHVVDSADHDQGVSPLMGAIDAAVAALAEQSAIDPDSTAGKAARWHAAVAVEAAAPAIRAAERERILLRAEAAATTLLLPGWMSEVVVMPLDRLRELLGKDS